MLHSALAHLGGIDSFVKPGETVLIQPNQSFPRSADTGCTSDPLIVAALIRMVRSAGAAKVHLAAASHGFLDPLQCMKRTGMAAIATQEEVEIVDLGSDSTPVCELTVTEGKVLHTAPIPVPLAEADVLITVPKAKTDYLDQISGALETAMGFVNRKWRANTLRQSQAIEIFADIMTVVRPDLCITDALVCGEGDGPAANVPHWCGSLLVAADFVATDVSIATLLDQDWRELRFAAACQERGLGQREPIVWLGTDLDRIFFHAWRTRAGFAHLPLNVLVGGGVTLAGTAGHVKSALDLLLTVGMLDRSGSAIGTPTIMIGDVADPDFEQHIAQGAYFVFDDVARPEYKNDARVLFVGGHPALDQVMSELIRGLGIELPNTNWASDPQQTMLRRVADLAPGTVGQSLPPAAESTY